MLWKKIKNIGTDVLLIAGLLIPLLIFLNRFLIPDHAFDSVNYHLYLGFKAFDFSGIKGAEFFPSGIHNFSKILDVPGYFLMKLFGYRLGTIGSLIAMYGVIFISSRIIKLILEEKWKFGFISILLFVNIFMSLEAFFQIATYFVDILSTTLILLALYWLFLGEKNKKYFLWSAVLMGLIVVTKYTNLIYLPAYGLVYLLLVLRRKEPDKIKILAVGFGLLIIVVLAGFFKNWKTTGNPVFPFYNAVFKSKYFSTINFGDGRFGGRNLSEKLTYPWFSFKNPSRLGEGHDLFNDFKLQIYFGIVLIAFGISFWERRKYPKMYYLCLFWMVSFFVWCLTFGYLRYALVLEILGGVIFLLMFLRGGKLRVFLVPVFLIMLLQDKRIMNNSLAYDLSWRPGYFYNRRTYFENFKDLDINKIIIEDTTKYDVYINCSLPNMSYYVLSDFNKLPVMSIDISGYKDLTENLNYQSEVKKRLAKYLGKNDFKFVTITAVSGLNTQYESCLKTLKNSGFIVKNEDVIDNFLGYKNQKLIIISGDASLNNIWEF
jgi:hypothetical protein